MAKPLVCLVLVGLLSGCAHTVELDPSDPEGIGHRYPFRPLRTEGGDQAPVPGSPTRRESRSATELQRVHRPERTPVRMPEVDRRPRPCPPLVLQNRPRFGSADSCHRTGADARIEESAAMGEVILPYGKGALCQCPMGTRGGADKPPPVGAPAPRLARIGERAPTATWRCPPSRLRLG